MPASRADHAYGALKAQLLAGDFAIGGRLAEERLAASLSVSRTPVREALSRLSAEGLVRRHPDGGYQPAVPDLDSIAELYEIRRSLELLAIGRPAAVGGGDGRTQLAALRDDWLALGQEPAGTDPEFVLLDEDFHLRLAAAAGNRALVDVLSGVNERIRIVRTQDFLTPERITATIAQHLGIVEALLAADPGLASRRLQHHLDESAGIVNERAAAALARMLGRGLR